MYILHIIFLEIHNDVCFSKDLKKTRTYIKKLATEPNAGYSMKPRDYQSQSGEEQKTVGALVLHT